MCVAGVIRPGYADIMHPLRFTQYLMIAWLLSELLIFRSDRQLGTGKREDGFSRPLIFVAMGLATWLAFTARARSWWLLPAAPVTWFAIGAAAMLAGIVVRQRAVRFLGAYFRTHVTMLDDHRLITDGPYARVRHPSYTGGLISCAGVGLALGSGASLLAMLLIPVAAFAYRIRIEERALGSHFGEAWCDYRARTKALIPFVW
jgi:protein-S-isoprenylcysteine O-methyltransferase